MKEKLIREFKKLLFIYSNSETIKIKLYDYIFYNLNNEKSMYCYVDELLKEISKI